MDPAALAPRFGPLRLAWWWTVRSLWGLAGAPLFRPRVTGAERLPRDGPYLLLPNHVSLLDPFWVGHPIGRPAWFMASRQVFRSRLLGPLLGSLGAFPKIKYVKDRAAMARVSELYEAGQVVVIFPEAERSWDGRTLTVLPGIGRLVKRLDARVVFCRILTGHLFQPRWARWPRWVPVRLEYSEPRTWGPEATPESIAADVQAAIALDPDGPEARLRPGERTFRWRSAWGLESYLWACPACFALGALRPHPDDGDAVACTRCGAAWDLGLEGELRPRAGAAEPSTVAAAYDAIRAHFGDPPVEDPARFERDGTILRCERARVGRVARGLDPEPWADGPMSLRRDAVVVGERRIPFAEVVAVAMELGNKVQLRTAEALYQVEPVGQSTLLWNDFIRAWLGLYRAGDPEAWRPS